MSLQLGLVAISFNVCNETVFLLDSFLSRGRRLLQKS